MRFFNETRLGISNTRWAPVGGACCFPDLFKTGFSEKVSQHLLSRLCSMFSQCSRYLQHAHHFSSRFVKEGSNSWETTVLQSFKPVSPIFFKMFPAILQDFSQDLSQDLSPRFIPGIFPRISPLSLQFPTSFENEALLPQRLCCLPSEFSLQRG